MSCRLDGYIQSYSESTYKKAISKSIQSYSESTYKKAISKSKSVTGETNRQTEKQCQYSRKIQIHKILYLLAEFQNIFFSATGDTRLLPVHIHYVGSNNSLPIIFIMIKIRLKSAKNLEEKITPAPYELVGSGM